MSERIANNEFVNWFEHWRAELKSRVLGEPTLREEGQGQVSPGREFGFQDLPDPALTGRDDDEGEVSVIPGPTVQPIILLHTNVRSSSETTVNPTKAV